jgi:hypothetical protein
MLYPVGIPTELSLPQPKYALTRLYADFDLACLKDARVMGRAKYEDSYAHLAADGAGTPA